MTNETEKLTMWLFENQGKTYESVRAEIDKLEWYTWYPIIDQHTRLTGKFHDSNDGGTNYEICDVRGLKIIRHDQATDAAIRK